MKFGCTIGAGDDDCLSGKGLSGVRKRFVLRIEVPNNCHESRHLEEDLFDFVDLAEKTNYCCLLNLAEGKTFLYATSQNCETSGSGVKILWIERLKY